MSSRAITPYQTRALATWPDGYDWEYVPGGRSLKICTASACGKYGSWLVALGAARSVHSFNGPTVR
ncbi:hypothetical protein GCM10027605_05840 [Micromonospora zhanjiangensis]